MIFSPCKTFYPGNVNQAQNREIKYSADMFSLYIFKKADSVPSRLLPIRRWSHGNSCIWAYDSGYTLLVPMNQRVLNRLSK